MRGHFLELQNSGLLYTSMDKDKFIERRGRLYEYSELDDTWYPVPTQDQYDFQRFVIFISAILLACYISYVVFTSSN